MTEDQFHKTVNLSTEVIAIRGIYESICAIESVAHILDMFIFRFEFVAFQQPVDDLPDLAGWSSVAIKSFQVLRSLLAWSVDSQR